ncbi:MAG TPA: LemA family protein [Terriglobia bacterium]|nr:LemA family protein [Terriglobia bacterium]
MKKWQMMVIVLIVIVAILIGAYVSIRNNMVRKQQEVKADWSQVDVVIQRRADLIPNLVNTVKGYATHEEAVFADVDHARAALLGASTPAGRIQANGQLDGALGRLLAVVENYPQLKANENFLELQDQLEGTENRIAVERRRYNQAVQDYNTYLGLFPNNLIAGMAGFTQNSDYFKASTYAQQVPKVDFSNAPPAAPAATAPH